MGGRPPPPLPPNSYPLNIHASNLIAYTEVYGYCKPQHVIRSYGRGISRCTFVIYHNFLCKLRRRQVVITIELCLFHLSYSFHLAGMRDVVQYVCMGIINYTLLVHGAPLAPDNHIYYLCFFLSDHRSMCGA